MSVNVFVCVRVSPATHCLSTPWGEAQPLSNLIAMCEYRKALQ